MFSEVLSVIWQAVIGLLLKLDGIVYDLICYFYEIFLFLAELDILENADYYNIVKRIYIILGVIMLFVLTYSLLRAVINPDNFSKGENSFGNIRKFYNWGCSRWRSKNVKYGFSGFFKN